MMGRRNKVPVIKEINSGGWSGGGCIMDLGEIMICCSQYNGDKWPELEIQSSPDDTSTEKKFSGAQLQGRWADDIILVYWYTRFLAT